MHVKITVVQFSIRGDSELSLQEMGTRVGEAVGCQFRVGKYVRTEALITEFLGAKVGLYCRPAPVGNIFGFSGHLEDAALVAGPDGEAVEIEVLDLGPAIAHLLRIRSLGDWHLPSEEELTADREYYS